MRIWKCPQCDSGVRAPERMKQGDARKYCLECSAKTGKIVVRVCPALERAKQKKAEATLAKRERKAQAAAAASERRGSRLLEAERARWAVGDMDLREWRDKIEALKLKRGKPNVPRVTRRRAGTGSNVQVRHGWRTNDVRLVLGDDPAHALGALMWGMLCDYSDERHWDNIQTAYHALVDRQLDLLSKKKSSRYRALVDALHAHFERQKINTTTHPDLERLERLAEMGDAEARRQLFVLERRHGL